jgi:hypothetical protein
MATRRLKSTGSADVLIARVVASKALHFSGGITSRNWLLGKTSMPYFVRKEG